MFIYKLLRKILRNISSHTYELLVFNQNPPLELIFLPIAFVLQPG
jgi:hypothetical protein